MSAARAPSGCVLIVTESNPVISLIIATSVFIFVVGAMVVTVTAMVAVVVVVIVVARAAFAT